MLSEQQEEDNKWILERSTNHNQFLGPQGPHISMTSYMVETR